MKKERWVSTRFYAVLLLDITFSGKSGQSLRRNSPNNFLVSFLSALENIWVFISTYKKLKIMRFHLQHKLPNVLMMCSIFGVKNQRLTFLQHEKNIVRISIVRIRLQKNVSKLKKLWMTKWSEGDSFRRKNTWSPLLCGDYNLNFSHVFSKAVSKVSKLSESQ